MIFHDYEPKLRKNPMLFFASAASAVCTAALWYFRERLSLTVPDMMMFTGVSLMIILLTLKNYFVKKENYSKAVELKKIRDDMSADDYSDNSIYYR